MKSSEIPNEPILKFLAKHKGKWCTWGPFVGSLPTVTDVMPPDTPRKVALTKMKALIRRGLVKGCGCGCRGDFEITAKGEAVLADKGNKRG